MTRRRAAATLAASAAGGAVLGVATRWVSADGVTGAERAGAALLAVLAAAPCVAAALADPLAARAARARLGGLVLAATAVGGAVAMLAAGAEGTALAAALVPAAAALLAHGAATLVRGLGASRGGATLSGAALPAALAAGVFVADPFVEWDGPGPGSPRIAQAFVAASPIAAATSEHGLAVDWLRMRLLYDGPAPGASGLSAIGQYYPTSSPAPWAWSGWAGLAGCALLLAAPRGRMPSP